MTREVCEHFNPVDQPCAKCEEKRKSEALFLADELEIPLGTVIQSEVCRRAAKELRRLHAELERCKQVCAATSEAWREEAALGCDHCNQPLYAAIKCRVCGRETPIIEPEIKGDNKPVAWLHVPYPGNAISPMLSLSKHREPSIYAASVPLYLKEQL